jgi:hypothetical protein
LADDFLIGGDNLGAHVGIELVPPVGVHRRVRLFGHQIGQALWPIGHIALGAAECPPILCDAPHLFIGVDQVITGTDLAERDRAFIDHEGEHFVKSVVKHWIIKVKVARYVPPEPSFQYFRGDLGISLHIGTGLIHGSTSPFT